MIDRQDLLSLVEDPSPNLYRHLEIDPANLNLATSTPLIPGDYFGAPADKELSCFDGCLEGCALGNNNPHKDDYSPQL
jgi:hypothetical protein